MNGKNSSLRQVPDSSACYHGSRPTRRSKNDNSYEAVLTRAEHLDASRLTVGQVNEVLDALTKVIIPVHMNFRWRPRLKDPGDEMVLETAVNGESDRLVTFNLRHLAAAAREFGIRALLPRDMWKEVQRNEKK